MISTAVDYSALTAVVLSEFTGALPIALLMIGTLVSIIIAISFFTKLLRSVK
jgi:hypothetical protein